MENERYVLETMANIGLFFYELTPLFFWGSSCAILWHLRRITLKKIQNLSLEH